MARGDGYAGMISHADKVSHHFRSPSGGGLGLDSSDGGFAAGLRVHKAINRRLTDAATKGGAHAVLSVTWTELSRMNGVNLATALHRIAKHCVDCGDMGASPSDVAKEVQSVPAFGALISALEQRARTAVQPQETDHYGSDDGPLPAQCASIVAWSLATLGIRNNPLLDVLALLAYPRLDEFKPFEVTNLLWAFAKLGTPCPDLYRSVSQRIKMRHKGEFKAQCLSLAVWSFATGRWRDEELFRSMAEELCSQASLLKPQEISNTLWAFGKQKINHRPLFHAFGSAASEGTALCRFKPQELANTLWAFASVGMSHPTLFAKAAATAARRSLNLSPGNIATILWAYSSVGCQDCPDLAPTLLDVAASSASQYKPRELASVARAAAQMCPHHLKFFDACAKSFQSRPQSFSLNHLAHLAEAFSVADKACSAPSWALPAILKEQQTQRSRYELQLPEFESGCNLHNFTGVSAISTDANSDGSDSGSDFDDCTEWPIANKDMAPPRERRAQMDFSVSAPALMKQRPPPPEGPNAWKSSPSLLADWNRQPPGLVTAPAPAPAAAELPTPALDMRPQPTQSCVRPLPTTCLFDNDGSEKSLFPGQLLAKAGCSNSPPSPLRLRYGMLDLQVILRPVPASSSSVLSGVSPWQASPYVLQPVAVIAETEGADASKLASGLNFLAYPYCASGNLLEFASASGPLSVGQ
ncbi:unnamed protein product, partial [Polarella glacialis]